MWSQEEKNSAYRYEQRIKIRLSSFSVFLNKIFNSKLIYSLKAQKIIRRHNANFNRIINYPKNYSSHKNTPHSAVQGRIILYKDFLITWQRLEVHIFYVVERI